jgi:hypothetical protein
MTLSAFHQGGGKVDVVLIVIPIAFKPVQREARA